MTQYQGSAVPEKSGTETQIRRQRVRTSLLLLLLGLLFFVWWSQPGRVRARPQPNTVRFPPEAGTEEQWIIGEIANNIAEMIAFATTKQSLPLATPESEIRSNSAKKEYLLEIRLGDTRPPVQARLRLVENLWSRQNFLPFTNQLMRAWGQGAVGIRSPVDPDMVVNLTNPTPQTLVREDKRISDALTKFPLDAELHEEAALLMGSFALRHTADCFYDVRRELSRMTAHLAVAKTLSENTGPCGEMAEAILNTLVGRQSAALENLRRLELVADTGTGFPREATTTWSQALTMRNTGDYRKFVAPTQSSLIERPASLLEELEYVRALRTSINSTAASTFLRNSLMADDYENRDRPEMLAEWAEIILSGPFSVGEGHTWTEFALQLEYREIAAVYQLYHDKQLDESEWSDALNVMAEHVTQDGHETHLQVLGWGSWAEMRQRQLCDVIRKTWDWLDDKYAAREEAKEFKTAMTKQFSSLRLFPMVDLEHDGDALSHRAYQGGAQTLANLHPDWVPYALWPDYIAEPPKKKQPSTVNTSSSVMKWAWFQPHFPAGTLYDCKARERGGLFSLSDEQLEQLRIMAPYNHFVLYCPTVKNRCTPEEMEAQFATVSAYDMWVMRIIANSWRSDPDKYETSFSALCLLDPDLYIELGDYLVKVKRSEAAAKAYQNAVDHAKDRIYVSNNVCWLAHYYYDNGRKDEAFEVAEMAADVYSSRGLDTMASLLECEGKLREAASYHQKIAERYNRWGDLALFYNKHRNDDPQFASEFDQVIRKVFPQGQEPVDVATLSGSPTDGVILNGMTGVTHAAGLNMGHVIVAINGIRLHNSKQYFYLMDSASSPKTEISFWSGENYRTASFDLPKHRLGVDISDFHQ